MSPQFSRYVFGLSQGKLPKIDNFYISFAQAAFSQNIITEQKIQLSYQPQSFEQLLH